MLKRIFVTTILLISFNCQLSASQEFSTTLNDQTHLAVTIYNNNLALVKDQRKIHLPPGQNTLAFREISAQIQPETALFRSLSRTDAINVIEQNFDFDLLSPQKLLDKYVGKEIGVVKTHPTSGEERTEFGTLLSNHQGPVIKIGDRIETGIRQRFVFPSVPKNLRVKPTLIMQINNILTEEQIVELSYLTQGLTWKADYVMSIHNDEQAMDLNGWVTLTNTSGTYYPNAQLQLAAGSINRVQPRPTHLPMIERTMAASSTPMTQESLFEYHLYTLAHNTNIADNQTKQVALLNAANIPIQKEYQIGGSRSLYHGRDNELGSKLPVNTYILFTNDEASRLGMPLPEGIIRAYKEDQHGNAQFIGEDNIEHTPKNEKIKLKLGTAFDITARKKQTAYKKITKQLVESEYLFELNNAKDQNVTVKIIEPIPGDWRILSESHPHKKTSSNTASWSIDIPSNSKATLRYRVQTQ